MRKKEYRRIITFASDFDLQKIRKKINIKGYVRKGKFVRASSREQDVRQKAFKVAAISLGVLGAALGVGIAGAALTKVRYNRNLVEFGKKIAKEKVTFKMKIPTTAQYYKTPKSTNKKSLTFFVGGRDLSEKVDGEVLMGGVIKAFKSKKTDQVHEFIPLYHSFQGSKPAEGGAMTLVRSIQENLEASVVRGYNPDSIAMANEIYKWHKLSPDKAINLITHSGGGFQGRDVPHILAAAGVNKKVLKIFSTGSPDFGLVDDLVLTKRVMNTDDIYAKTIPGFRKGRVGITSLHRNTEFVPGALSDDYKNLVLKKSRIDAKKAGKEPKPMSEFELTMAAHLHPAYYRTKTKSPAAQKTLDILQKFMFND